MKKYLYHTVLLIALVLSISACSTTPQVIEPTTDLNALKTEVAATIRAEYTQQALSQPTLEQKIEEPTNTPYVITATFAPTSTAPVVIPSHTAVVSSASSSNNNVVMPTTPPAPAKLVSQSPADGTTYGTGQSFDGVFTVKNTSTKNWNSSYYIRYVGGELIPSQKQVMISDPPSIGGTATFTVDYIAPSTGGRHTTNWELVDDNGAAILSFYLVINVE